MRYKEPVIFSVWKNRWAVSHSWITISDGSSTIEASGLSGSAGVGWGLFHQAKASKIHIHQTMVGETLLDLFHNTVKIQVKSVGGALIYDNVRGYDSSDNMMWEADMIGSMFGGTGGVSQGSTNFVEKR